MTNPALDSCTIADMDANPDDLLVLLAVSRSAKFTTAAQALGLNHTTVSRRIAALEKALGGRVLVPGRRRLGADGARRRRPCRWPNRWKLRCARWDRQAGRPTRSPASYA